MGSLFSQCNRTLTTAHGSRAEGDSRAKSKLWINEMILSWYTSGTLSGRNSRELPTQREKGKKRGGGGVVLRMGKSSGLISPLFVSLSLFSPSSLPLFLFSHKRNPSSSSHNENRQLPRRAPKSKTPEDV